MLLDCFHRTLFRNDDVLAPRTLPAVTGRECVQKMKRTRRVAKGAMSETRRGENGQCGGDTHSFSRWISSLTGSESLPEERKGPAGGDLGSVVSTKDDFGAQLIANFAQFEMMEDCGDGWVKGHIGVWRHVMHTAYKQFSHGSLSMWL